MNPGWRIHEFNITFSHKNLSENLARPSTLLWQYLTCLPCESQITVQRKACMMMRRWFRVVKGSLPHHFMQDHHPLILPQIFARDEKIGLRGRTLSLLHSCTFSETTSTGKCIYYILVIREWNRAVNLGIVLKEDKRKRIREREGT